MKLKNELSVLVDMNLWSTALQDVKNREKTGKSRISDLSVEVKVRNEELQRNQIQCAESKQAVNSIERELAIAKEKQAHELGKSSQTILEQFGNFTVEEMSLKLNKIMNMKQQVTTLDIIPLRDRLIELNKLREQQLKEATSQTTHWREKLVHLNASNAAVASAHNVTVSKNKQLQIQLQNLTKNATTTFSQFRWDDELQLFSTVLSSRFTSEIVDEVRNNLEKVKVRHQQRLAEMTSLDVQLTALKKAIQRIQEISSSSLPSLPSSASICNVHSAESCPTCGQGLPVQQRQQREKDLLVETSNLNTTRKSLAGEVSMLLQQLQSGDKMILYCEQLLQFQSRELEYSQDIQAQSVQISSYLKEKQNIDKELEVAKQQLDLLVSQFSTSVKVVQDALKAGESKLSGLAEDETKTRATIEQVRVFHRCRFF